MKFCIAGALCKYQMAAAMAACQKAGEYGFQNTSIFYRCRAGTEFHESRRKAEYESAAAFESDQRPRGRSGCSAVHPREAPPAADRGRKPSSAPVESDARACGQVVRYQMWNGSSDDVLEHLARGLSDLAVIAYPFDNEHLDSIVIGKEPWIAIIPKNHPLAVREGTTVKLSELADYPLISPRRNSRIEAIRKWFEGIGKEPNIVCEMSNYLDAVALSEQNVGFQGNHRSRENRRVSSGMAERPAPERSRAGIHQLCPGFHGRGQDALRTLPDEGKRIRDPGRRGDPLTMGLRCFTRVLFAAVRTLTV